MNKPIYLYIKRHNITGLLYFGRTVQPDPNKYKGSGSHWRNHLKKHGGDISTIFFEKFLSQEDATEFAEFFSTEFDIVNSKKFANACIEDGKPGSNTSGIPLSKEHRHKVRLGLRGKTLTDEHKNNISKSLQGKTRNPPRFILYSCIKCKREMVTSKLNLHNNCLSEDEIIDRKLNPPARKITMLSCPHCGLTGRSCNIKRYHFDKCKFKI